MILFPFKIVTVTDVMQILTLSLSMTLPSSHAQHDRELARDAGGTANAVTFVAAGVN